MEKLYSTPLGGAPQPLPSYWRFEDGTVRTDLPDLSDEELAKLGWLGPIEPPIRKTVIFKSQLTEQQISYYENYDKYTYNEEDESWTFGEDVIFKKDLINVRLPNYENFNDYEYDEKNESWTLKFYDYDPEISKIFWSTKKRAYLILGLDEDESLIDYEPPVSWDKFKMSLFKSEKFNKYVLDLSIKYPVISTSLSIEIKNLNQGFHPEFINIWEYAKECFPLPEDVILELTEISNSSNLTEKDLNFLIEEDKKNGN